MATAIVKKGPDNWQVAVDLGRDSAGKRRRVTKTVRGPRSEAVRAEANLRNQSAQWSPDTGGRTVADLLDEWLNRRPGTLSPTTTAEYRRIARSRIVPEFGARDVDSIRRRDLDDFYGRLLAGGLSPNSVRQVHAVIRRAYVCLRCGGGGGGGGGGGVWRQSRMCVCVWWWWWWWWCVCV